MTLVLITALRLALWLLLTADAAPINLAIGLAVSLLLPRGQRPAPPLRELLPALGAALAAIPQAYGEAFALILARDCRSRIVTVAGSGSRSDLVRVLEVFRITLTPLTLVLGFGPGDSYRVHELVPEARGRNGGRR
jgi:multicomponent Na+:H+ antiporter subunit E